MQIPRRRGSRRNPLEAAQRGLGAQQRQFGFETRRRADASLALAAARRGGASESLLQAAARVGIRVGHGKPREVVLRLEEKDEERATSGSASAAPAASVRRGRPLRKYSVGRADADEGADSVLRMARRIVPTQRLSLARGEAGARTRTRVYEQPSVQKATEQVQRVQAQAQQQVQQQMQQGDDAAVAGQYRVVTPMYSHYMQRAVQPRREASASTRRSARRDMHKKAHPQRSREEEGRLSAWARTGSAKHDETANLARFVRQFKRKEQPAPKATRRARRRSRKTRRRLKKPPSGENDDDE